jgi:tripartite-type tricarboxylate transporter receptor subunit TctC
LHAPAGTPLPIRAAINRMFQEPFKDPAFEPAFIKTGDVPVRNSIEDFEKFMKGQQDRWVGTANRLGIKLTAD